MSAVRNGCSSPDMEQSNCSIVQQNWTNLLALVLAQQWSGRGYWILPATEYHFHSQSPRCFVLTFAFPCTSNSYLYRITRYTSQKTVASKMWEYFLHSISHGTIHVVGLYSSSQAWGIQHFKSVRMHARVTSDYFGMSAAEALLYVPSSTSRAEIVQLLLTIRTILRLSVKYSGLICARV